MSAAERVRELRADVLETMLTGNDTLIEYHGGPESHKWQAGRERCQRENAEELDAYAAAVRAETLAERDEWMSLFRDRVAIAKNLFRDREGMFVIAVVQYAREAGVEPRFAEVLSMDEFATLSKLEAP